MWNIRMEGGGEMKARYLGEDLGEEIGRGKKAELPFLLSLPHSVSQFVKHTVRPN